MARKSQGREARIARQRLRNYNARQAVHARQAKRRRRDNLFAAVALVVVLALATGAQVAYYDSGPGQPQVPETPAPTPSATATPPG